MIRCWRCVIVLKYHVVAVYFTCLYFGHMIPVEYFFCFSTKCPLEQKPSGQLELQYLHFLWLSSLWSMGMIQSEIETRNGMNSTTSTPHLWVLSLDDIFLKRDKIQSYPLTSKSHGTWKIVCNSRVLKYPTYHKVTVKRKGISLSGDFKLTTFEIVKFDCIVHSSKEPILHEHYTHLFSTHPPNNNKCMGGESRKPQENNSWQLFEHSLTPLNQSDLFVITSFGPKVAMFYAGDLSGTDLSILYVVFFWVGIEAFIVVNIMIHVEGNSYPTEYARNQHHNQYCSCPHWVETTPLVWPWTFPHISSLWVDGTLQNYQLSLSCKLTLSKNIFYFKGI